MSFQQFTKIEEGTLIDGRHFHLYKDTKTGLYDLGIEEVNY